MRRSTRYSNGVIEIVLHAAIGLVLFEIFFAYGANALAQQIAYQQGNARGSVSEDDRIASSAIVRGTIARNTFATRYSE